MDRDKLFKTIVYECAAKDGFLVNLRAIEFQEENFNNLFKALTDYREVIRTEEKMSERSVAMSLHYLDIGMLSALQYANGEFMKKLSKAHEFLIPLIEGILAPGDWSDFPKLH